MNENDLTLPITVTDQFWQKLASVVREEVRTEVRILIQEDKEKTFYSLDEISKQFGVSKATLHAMCNKGLIHRYKPNGVGRTKLKLKEVEEAFRQRRPYQKIKLD